MTPTLTRWRRPARQNRTRQAYQRMYHAAAEDPRIEGWHETLRISGNAISRSDALARLADVEVNLHLLHDEAYGREPWPDDTAGDAATGHANAAMILKLLRATERARATSTSWTAHHTRIAWARDDLANTDEALALACAHLLDRLSAENDTSERAALYTLLWIAACPVIGGQAAEIISVLCTYQMNQAVDRRTANDGAS